MRAAARALAERLSRAGTDDAQCRRFFSEVGCRMPRLMRRALSVALLCTACRPHGAAAEVYPPPDVYDTPATFVGEWLGEVDATMGTLRISELEPLRYRGVFRSDDKAMFLVLSLDHVEVTVAPQETMHSNQARFTWQDGRGGRGHGYLIVGREDTSLTGQYGLGEDVDGSGEWTFIRVE